MENTRIFRIQFENLSVAESTQKISQLRDILLDLSPNITAEIVKDTQLTQDLGTILVLILGTQAVVTIAEGIANYLSRVNSSLVITNKDGRIIAKGIKGSDLAQIIEALSQEKKGKK